MQGEGRIQFQNHALCLHSKGLKHVSVYLMEPLWLVKYPYPWEITKLYVVLHSFFQIKFGINGILFIHKHIFRNCICKNYTFIYSLTIRKWIGLRSLIFQFTANQKNIFIFTNFLSSTSVFLNELYKFHC